MNPEVFSLRYHLVVIMITVLRDVDHKLSDKAWNRFLSQWSAEIQHELTDNLSRALHSFNTKLALNFPETFPNLDILCQTVFFTSCFRILSECTPPCRRLEIRKRVKPWRELEFL